MVAATAELTVDKTVADWVGWLAHQKVGWKAELLVLMLVVY